MCALTISSYGIQHYHDVIFCAAGRVIKLIHEDVVKISSGKYDMPSPDEADPQTLGGNTGVGATYHAFHIRRGDFQYHDMKISADEIWQNTRHLLNKNITPVIYISTDEKDKSFFRPFMDHFEIKFLEDYYHIARLDQSSLNQNHIGMIEQVICANAHTFIGTPLSTFTGYITRMRGYYRDNRYSRTFYTKREHMYQLHQMPELVGPFWAREFAVAHVDIDDDLVKSYYRKRRGDKNIAI